MAEKCLRVMKEDIKPISEIIDYPVNGNGDIVTRRKGLSQIKPKLNAPPPNQIGSVDWTMNHLFGSTEKAIEMIESLVAGQGSNADEKWIRFILQYRQWEIDYKKDLLPAPPTLNQVCHSLDFDVGIFLKELQSGIQQVMKSLSHLRASLDAPAIVSNLTKRASSEEADVREMELALKIGGVIDSSGGVNVQINNTNQNAVMLKSEKEQMKNALHQFRSTVIDIDDEVRKEEKSNSE